MSVLESTVTPTATPDETLERSLQRPYEHGFVTDIESVSLPPGLDEGTIRAISHIKKEPEFLLKWRLAALERWFQMPMPDWAHLRIGPIDFQALSYYSAPKSHKDGPKSLDEVDPKLLETYEKLGVPLHERARLAGVAVDAVFDSVSVGTTFRKQLHDVGVIFCSFSHAVQEHPELIEKYLGTVVPQGDNFYAALNSAVFSDGSFVYIPEGVRCPMELSSYFRINAQNTGQFERTLIIAEPGSHVSYLEGCTAPQRDENQLHAAVVELIAHDDAHIKYSTVQNWYPGDENGVGGIYNFVTKRGVAAGKRSRISWTQVETGSAITWKSPSVVLRGVGGVQPFGAGVGVQGVAGGLQRPAGQLQRRRLGLRGGGVAQPQLGRRRQQVAEGLGLARDPAAARQVLARGQHVGLGVVHAATLASACLA